MQFSPIDFLPILIQLVLSAGFVAITIFVSSLLGPKRNSQNKDMNFECGVSNQIGNARSPFNVKYFLIAILFVLFDVEVIFLYPWAVNFVEMGWEGFAKMGIFLFVIVVGLLYEYKRRGLEWDK